MNQNDQDNNKERKGTGFLNTLISTFAAAGGVQTKSNRERDFEHGKPSTFVIAGILFVIAFIFTMYGIVQLVMSLAAS